MAAPSVTLQEIKRQAVRVGSIIGLLMLVGTLGYCLLGHLLEEPAPLLDCLYMTVITLTTVGYDEVIPVADTEVGRLFSVLLILSGAGILFYSLSSLSVMVMEGVLQGAWERWRMEREIAKMRNHYIICGVGRVGEVILRELALTKRPAVAIDSDAERLTALAKELGMPFVIGDATEEATLKAAGVEHAKGLLAALGNDHENLFLVITARSLNPHLRIIARGSDPSVVDKMQRAGADEVILTEAIGGLRMVSMMVRPAAVNFLDQMLRERDLTLRIEEIGIANGSPLAGKRLADLQIPQRWNTLVLAYRKGDGTLVYNPPAETVLERDMTLVVMGDVDKIAELRRIASGQ